MTRFYLTAEAAAGEHLDWVLHRRPTATIAEKAQAIEAWQAAREAAEEAEDDGLPHPPAYIPRQTATAEDMRIYESLKIHRKAIDGAQLRPYDKEETRSQA